MTTNKTPWTQGPWKFESGNGKYFPSVHIGTIQPEIVINAGGGELSEHEANARAIACTPEALELVDRLANRLYRAIADTDTDAFKLFLEAKALLTRARGK